MNKQISPDLKLVRAAADWDGLLLDLYASVDQDGYELAAITVHGGKVDLIPALSKSCIDHFSFWVEMNSADIQRSVRSVARLERHDFSREFRVAA